MTTRQGSPVWTPRNQRLRKRLQSDLRPKVLILGSGPAGLYTAYYLLKLDYLPIVVEAEDLFASGSSRRNQGWGQSGFLYLALLESDLDAEQVFRECSEGFAQLIKRVDGTSPQRTILEVNEAGYERLGARCDTLGLKLPRELAPGEVRRRAPLFDGAFFKAFEVPDLSVDTTLVLSSVVQEIIDFGGEVVSGKVRRESDGTWQIAPRHESAFCVDPVASVIAAGKDSVKVLHALDQNIPVRLFKSSLLCTPRIPGDNVYSGTASGVTLFHHGQHSIWGMNSDAVPVSIEAALEPDREQEQRLRAACQRAYPDVDFQEALSWPCVKPDAHFGGERSRGATAVELQPGLFFALSGKFTSGPVAGQRIAALIDRRFRFAPRVFEEITAPR
jgi:glycine/D-amino acid oxidase-like deaminating enzyme